ncbi:short-chain dehydrogenase [Botrytis cinerea]
MLCELCTRINVTDLVNLGITNYKNYKNERNGEAATEFLYWNHAARYDDLKETAQAGCELCHVLLRALDEKFWHPGEGLVMYRDILVRMEKEGCSLGFHVTIDSEDTKFHGMIEPGIIPREKEDYLTSRFATGKPRASSNTLGNSSAAATLNVAPTKAYDAEGTKIESLRSTTPKIKPYTGHQLDFRDDHLLTDSTGQARFVGPFQIGHFTLDPDLRSEINFNIARKWITTCSEDHDECPDMDDKPLPTRVIDVGSDDREPRLVSTNHQMGKFIALSHCWGGSVADKAKLTTENAELFKSEIPMSALPANFVDAILITRSLGLEYLWIDCLCIIQNSREDWEIESKHMGDVYHDAVVTLAAAAAPKATDGMLHTFSSYDLTGGPAIKLKLSQESTSEDTVDIVHRDSTREDLGQLLHKGPLASRGWTLQEEILCPRTLHYGNQQIHWQCLHQYSSGDGIHDYDVHRQRAFRYERIKDRIFKQTRSPDQDPHDPKDVNQILLEYHGEMVADYCTRSLSFASDKFPAFSGIASLVHGELKHGGFLDTVYLAGIWSSHLREGLLWYYGEKATFFSPKPDTNPISNYTAPSWSWASVDGKIEIIYTKPLTTTHLDPILSSHNIVLASTNPYGAITSADLLIQGSLLSMREATDHGIASLSSGEIFWDPVPASEKSRGFGRRSDIWMVRQKAGEPWLVTRKKDEKEEGEEQDMEVEIDAAKTKEREKTNSAKFKRLPYKVLFVASQNRFAYGLVLEKVKTEKVSTPEAKANVDEAKQGETDEVQDVIATSSRSLGEAPDEKRVDSIARTLSDIDIQDETVGLEADLDSDICTYRRIGIVKFQIKVATKKWNLDRFKWMDMKWERRKLRLV